MLLNDLEIRNEMLLSPFCSEKVRHDIFNRISYGSSSFGYDIRLASHDFQIIQPGTTEQPIIDPKNFENTGVTEHAELYSNNNTALQSSEKFFILPPHSYALGVSIELFSIPKDVLGIAVGKSTYARCGVIINITPLEPGWQGFLTIEMYNASKTQCKIYAEEGIAQLLFFKGNEPSQKYSGNYQNQGNHVKYAKV